MAESANLAGLIDHTILKPDASQAQVLEFCAEARMHKFRSVCVNSVHVQLVAEALRGSGVLTCSVVGFPFGAMPADVKAAETARAVSNGAEEIDMVIDIGALKEGRVDVVRHDIAAVRAACAGVVLKVIIETCLLTDDQKRAVCRIAKEEHADFVKTSTGYSTSGATVDDIALMRAAVGPDMGVKASGGVRTREVAEAMIAAGATRIGSSSGIAIVTSAAPSEGTY